MSNPPSAFVAIVQQKCPQCRNGKIFKYPAYHLRFSKMNETCPNCGLHYEIEVGFFWGAMYISYGFTVIIGIIAAVAIYTWLKDPAVYIYLGILALIFVILSPLIFRYSRVLMLYLFGGLKFKPALYKIH
jgi:uncharacterized protein (DUF983 family)